MEHVHQKYIQTHHWHLSQARRQSTGYRGTHQLDQSRVRFPEDALPGRRLQLLAEHGYRLVTYDRFEIPVQQESSA